MQTIQAKTSRGEYPILIGQGLIKSIGAIASGAWTGQKAMIVTDSNVAPLYLDSCRTSLLQAGIAVCATVIPAGEQSKNLKTLSELYTAFHGAGLSRTDGVVALGGGVVGDVAGFAAATYLRGLPLLQVPTTLLAQVDSAIGGKTGIDMPFGKNMVGAFYPPCAVAIDPETLKTLSPHHLAAGMAEVIKYGCILDAGLFAAIEDAAIDRQNIIQRCAGLKANVVARDEHDTGQRMLLNFGHTIGHAVEKATGFDRYSHGEAVAMGMVAAVRIGEALGVTSTGVQERLINVLEMWKLPVELPLPPAEVLPALSADKKQLGGKIHFVLLTEMGQALLHQLTIKELATIAAEVCYHA
ncbi:MAG TPA: 3-dehydroquinate synthase [Firmicutes bacterium]|nr:3-dehydroquinate synthase [Bacillota bacterium]